MAEANDYVKQIIAAQVREEREHWAAKQFHDRHGWAGVEIK